MKIGIAGTGGIGSNVAVFLVRSGVRRLKLVDFDRVDGVNLNRQFYFRDQIGRPKVEMLAENLLRIAPEARIERLVMRLDAGNLPALFDDCDAVVEGFDGSTEKKLLLEALAPTGRLIVSASGVAGRSMEAITTRRMGSCTIIGDFQTDAADARCYAPKVAAVAAMMAHVILEKGGYYD
ncbi:MAG: sulfur carrier protein ThiS adenylyltransferase ThiF [Desulfobacteraceae bacterium]|nr:MAG: sulfur carrier protein ThiS adenylyltransferase ThiF [Desulfobacteraceae bacterium]